jgi:EamA domain-containing membrane protein RarD
VIDPIRALFGLLRIGARFREFRACAARVAQRGVVVVTLVSVALSALTLALCLLIYAVERALVPRFGEVGSPLLLALILVIAVGVLLFTAIQLLKVPRPPPAPVVPTEPEEMTTAALLALIAGVVVGTVLQARKESKD